MAGIVDTVRDNNGVFLMIYTSNSQNMQPEGAYNQFGKYFEPDYMSGQNPPATFSFWPWTAVIDLDTMIVLARGPQVTLPQIVNMATQANE
ncbi:MAG: hypothetical protein GY854_30165 [Deltaproteobacteria bacterium]|nr:hypothetical protein [Deltaproteobacteria bacterium]